MRRTELGCAEIVAADELGGVVHLAVAVEILELSDRHEASGEGDGGGGEAESLNAMSCVESKR